MIKKYLSTIRQCELFQNIPEDELGVMLDCLNPQIRNYRRNECIALAGTEFGAIGIVLSGNVPLSKKTWPATG
jgi:signal-transduction protein with cAMP-binding, CBS, and nucleotidyltransferase domain